MANIIYIMSEKKKNEFLLQNHIYIAFVLFRTQKWLTKYEFFLFLTMETFFCPHAFSRSTKDTVTTVLFNLFSTTKLVNTYRLIIIYFLFFSELFFLPMINLVLMYTLQQLFKFAPGYNHPRPECNTVKEFSRIFSKITRVMKK